MKHYIFVVIVALVLASPVLAGLTISPTEPKGPAPDAAVIGGVPQPSALPSCGVKAAGVYGDTNGCLYACADQKRTVLASGSAACVLPTTTVTPTPTATVTLTPTPTATST